MVSTLTKAVLIVTILSVAIATPLIVYYITLPSTPSLPEVPQHLKTTSYGSYEVETTDVKFFVVNGVVQNNLTYNVNAVNVTATLYNVANETIATNIGHSELDIVEPKEEAPFEIYFLSSSLKDVPHHLKLEALGFPTDKEPVTGVRVLPETLVEDYDPATGYHSIVGEVLNSGNRKAFSVTVICVYYDSKSSVSALSRFYVSPELSAGATAPFELSSKPRGIDSESYDLYVAVHHYETVLFSNYVFLVILISAFVVFIVLMKRRGW